jgi:hypothetical protein
MVSAVAHLDLPLLVALGRAFYWQRLLEEGEYEDAEGIEKVVAGEGRTPAPWNNAVTPLQLALARGVR